ncbi:hypothetical protein BSL78_26674 [Apostichopus japonicus]|uniref:Arpin n=1 Tax=Stichopus japonicus TaxID=307972 RepID=A0A2G8JL97_STIJA|nr:hypothetical protein BSL78_26674 [Apostichopus japonicus]
MQVVSAELNKHLSIMSIIYSRSKGLVMLTLRINVILDEERQLDPLDLEDGDKVRIKSNGDGPFIYSISKIEPDSQTISNAAGPEKQVGESWTDKIMDLKAQGLPQAATGGTEEGAGATMMNGKKNGHKMERVMAL